MLGKPNIHCPKGLIRITLLRAIPRSRSVVANHEALSRLRLGFKSRREHHLSIWLIIQFGVFPLPTSWPAKPFPRLFLYNISSLLPTTYLFLRTLFCIRACEDTHKSQLLIADMCALEEERFLEFIECLARANRANKSRNL
jgi:hypothetical protein